MCLLFNAHWLKFFGYNWLNIGPFFAACTYVGAGKIKEMPKRTTFVRVTQQLNEVYGAHGGGSDRT